MNKIFLSFLFLFSFVSVLLAADINPKPANEIRQTSETDIQLDWPCENLFSPNHSITNY
ncbi:MAG: hypothetical protein O9346_10395 [Leptospiraceae bacterium]|nr:hypothetical protein [Leptospiraceae bacterium]MCZ8346816.1 hypothetical protein [Leptospiraceae bacterium]